MGGSELGPGLLVASKLFSELLPSFLGEGVLAESEEWRLALGGVDPRGDLEGAEDK